MSIETDQLNRLLKRLMAHSAAQQKAIEQLISNDLQVHARLKALEAKKCK